VCAAAQKPFNFMVGIKGKSFTVAALAAGVKRISLATSLYRAAMTGLLNAAKEVREHGTFGYIDTSLATTEMNAFFLEEGAPQHWRVATTAGIPPEDIQAVRDWRNSERLTPADRAILAATDECLDGKSISDAAWTR